MNLLENVDWQELGYKTEEDFLDAYEDYLIQKERDEKAEEQKEMEQ